MQRLCLILVVGLLFQGCRPSGEVTVSASSEIRIVSLAPSITEAVCAVGAGNLLVGRTSACNYPPDELATVPVIGGFGVPSLELLAQARPTLVLETALADESIGAQLDAMGVPRKRVRCRSLDDIPSMLREIGALTGHAADAEVLASALAKELSQLKAVPVNENSPKVYAEIWHDPMTTIGKGTFLSDLIEIAGGQSVGDGAGRDYYQISPEHVISTNPDVILCLYMGKNEGASDALKSRPGWQHINAVRHDAVYDGLSNDVLLRPGPRVLEGVAQLKQCFLGKSK
jgi:iron complex transport system substrate-binding protein